jgi:hypothetical protein
MRSRETPAIPATGTRISVTRRSPQVAGGAAPSVGLAHRWPDSPPSRRPITISCAKINRRIPGAQWTKTARSRPASATVPISFMPGMVSHGGPAVQGGARTGGRGALMGQQAYQH